MAARKLDKPEWRQYFDSLSRSLKGAQAEIEVAALPLGDQVQADWLPLFGITYDPKDDLVEIALEGLDHLIPKPRDIFLDADAGQLLSVEIVDADGGRQIVRLREPLLLAPPQTTQSRAQTQR